MNFRLNISGCRFNNFNDCVKFISYSASQSDYIVSIEGFKRLTPFSPYFNKIELTGSSKKTYKDIILDMDDIFIKSPGGNIFLSPEILELPVTEKGIHYWGILGALFKIVGDISPAYVTGHLIEKGMKRELEIFTELYSSLPVAFQAAVSEFLQSSVT